jgi:hypothetical protein
MPVELSFQEIDILKQLEAAGKRGRTMSEAVSREAMDRLVKFGLVTNHAPSVDTVLYLITDRGKLALNTARGKAVR